MALRPASCPCSCQGMPWQEQGAETCRQLDPGQDALLLLLKFLLGHNARFA
jgi:hypothetical protein